MTAAVRRRRWAPASGQTAVALAGLTLLLAVASAVLMGLTGDFQESGDGGTVALTLAFLAMGFLIALRQPRNPTGWLLMCTGLSSAFTTAAQLYLRLDYGLAHGALLFTRAVFLVQNTLWPVSILAGMAAVLVFPDGRLSRPWRRALWAYAAVSVLVLVTQAIPAVVLVSTGNVQAAVTGHLAHVPGGATVRLLASGLPVLTAVPFWVAWVTRQVAGFRHAEGDARQQYKWFTAGAAAALVAIVVLTVAESGGGSGIAAVVNVIAIYAAVAFPLGIGVAILRYRLFDIDRIISRTLAYTIVTGLLVGVYAGLVLLATRILAVASAESVAAATLAAAALFSPLRRRVQRIVDRRFNRARYNADRTIAAFAGRLQGAVDLDTVSGDLTGVVHAALEPAHVSLWIAGGSP